MVDPATTQRWGYRLLFVALAAVLLFLRLLPLDMMPATLPGPDLLLCLVFAWVQRRPDIVTPLLLGALLFLSDMLLGRAPGLWAALALIAAEFLRSRHQGSAEMPFAVELAFVAGAVIALTVAYWAAQGIFAVPAPGLSDLLMQAVFTLTAYPAVVGVSQLGFNIRRLSPTEADSGGAR
ncbi:rod shape-determining protein MreD [Actibacterium sp. MT2.3-13A]|uniref:rod shape-determining protein MreD n=1 Tax=Actibacterium sp. MT2.3-13A TaxID=2828332 RepID=UPI001BADB73C|nr:rod shape-determining protein MreD [Actibacterium sp. MT2.3-13A]